MDLVKKYNEMVSEISSKLDYIYNNEIETLKTFLKATDIEKYKAFSNNETDNKVMSLYEFKDGVLEIIVTMIENGIRKFDPELVSLVGDVVISDIPIVSGESAVLLEEIVKKIYKKCFYVLFYTGDISKLQNIKKFVEKQDIPDFRNVCLSILFKVDHWSSFDLESLSTLSSPAVVYDLVRMYKEDLIEEIRYKLVKGVSLLISRERDPQELKNIYLIFSEINQFKFEDLVTKPVDGEYSNEYFMFIHSLVVDSSSAVQAFNLLVSGGLFDNLRDGISDIITMNIVENRDVDPNDEEFVLHLIEIMSRILSYRNQDLEYIRLYFIRFIDPLMRYITGGVGIKTRGSVFSFLDQYMDDEESKIGITEFFRTTKFFRKENFLRDVEEEMKTGCFFSTPKALKFLSYLDLELAVECALYALRSEDVKTIRIAFDLFSKTDKNITQSILLNARHIRIAMLRSESLTRYIARFQAEKGVVLNDVGIISVIVATSNPDFFSFVRLFDNFGLFLNGKFLDRISESKKEGLEYLIKATENSSEACKFVESNQEYFNSLMEDFPVLSPLLCHIYDNLLEFDIENIEISFTDGFRVREMASAHLFSALSKKLAYAYLTQSTIDSKYITNKSYALEQDSIQSYMLYLKARLVIGDNIDTLIADFVSCYENTDEIVGYYKIVTGKDIVNKTSSVIACFDKKDSSLFVKLYPRASTLERFLLYFTIDTDDNDVKNIIKEEVTRITLSKNMSMEDRMILRQCIYSLLRMKNIDSIVRLIDDFEDTTLLLKLNIRNIATGGMYFNPQLVRKGSIDLQICAVFILYYNNIWNHSLLKDWIVHLYKENRSNKDLEYLVGDINRKNEYGFEIQLL
ncbi:hypothetical protein NGRA_2225 [Nosema granulosis]|uniref:Uncharacterized protein n=1 Tax=Nosema granulosis TaxID=83296 RepID=A0A9P6GYJ5_9MICR|nr:hypothetical protein NGRA_2225 [Nosema granulosis]